MMRRNLKVVLVIGMIGVSILVVAAYRPKCRYAFGGAWVGQNPDDPEAIFYFHISRDDIVGKRDYSLYINHFNIDASLGGFFPEAVIFGDGVGHGHATGKETFDYTAIICALDAHGFVQYYMVGSGEGRWVNADEQMFDAFTVFVYLPSQDVNPYDGLPDEGEEPILCIEFPVRLQRIPHYPPCIPAPTPA